MSISRKKFLTHLGGGLASVATLGNSLPVNAEMPPLIKPRRLRKGSTLGLIAPASPIYEEEVFNNMLQTLRQKGFKLKTGAHATKKYGYLAGRDEERVSDLHDMFANEEVDGILCIRGGWGSNRILPMIDYELIKNNPKVFCGFSDITSLHLAIRKKTGLVTFHGPVGKSEWNKFTWQHFKTVVMDGEKDHIKIPAQKKQYAFTICEGEAEGILMGGNLTVLTATLGSEFIPEWENVILFLEDIGEPVYKIDRMLTQLKLNGILNRISGFVFGQCTECEAGENSLSFKQVMDHHIKPLGIPAFSGAMIGHEENNATLPFGIKAAINADRHSISLLEYSVL